METVYLSYSNLTPGLEDKFSDKTFKTIIAHLRNNFPHWKGFLDNNNGYSISYTITTKKAVKELLVKGPTTFKKLQKINFSIFLPDSNYDLFEYLDLVFEGIARSLQIYNISKESIDKIKEECKKEFR